MVYVCWDVVPDPFRNKNQQFFFSSCIPVVVVYQSGFFNKYIYVCVCVYVPHTYISHLTFILHTSNRWRKSLVEPSDHVLNFYPLFFFCIKWTCIYTYISCCFICDAIGICICVCVGVFVSVCVCVSYRFNLVLAGQYMHTILKMNIAHSLAGASTYFFFRGYPSYTLLYFKIVYVCVCGEKEQCIIETSHVLEF